MKNKYIIAMAVTLSVIITPLFIPSSEVSYVAPEPPPPKLTHRQEVWLSALEWCESSGRPDIKILDSNDKYSYGSFQFQMSTFLHFGKKYGLIATSTTEAQEGESLIYDYNLQKKLVARMAKDGLEHHWKVCHGKIGDYPR